MKRSMVVLGSLLMACGGGGSAQPPASPAAANNAAIVNGCNGGDYSDHTADEAAQGTHIKWDPSIATSNDRCIKIKLNSDVIFAGDFANHPIAASGGDSGNPVAVTEENHSNPGTGDEMVKIHFAKTGVFGFACSKHPEMKGAVLVVP